MSSQEVIDYVNERIARKSLTDIVSDVIFFFFNKIQICSYCCATDTSGDGTGCDNMTIIIVDLIKNKRAYIVDEDKDSQSPILETNENGHFKEENGHSKEGNGHSKEGIGHSEEGNSRNYI